MSYKSDRDWGIIIPSFLDDYPLDPFEFRLYSHIARRAGQGQCWEGVEKIASHCQIDVKTARLKIKNLQAYGMIRVEKRSGKTDLITLTSQDDWMPAEAHPSRQRSTPTKNGTPSKTGSPTKNTPTKFGTPSKNGRTTPTKNGTPPLPNLVPKGYPIKESHEGGIDPSAVEGKPQPIALPSSEREVDAEQATLFPLHGDSTNGKDPASSASAPDEVKTEQEQPKPSKPAKTPRKKPPANQLGAEEFKRAMAAYNENKPACWSRLEVISTERQRILKKWTGDLGNFDAVIDAIEKALRFAANDDFWSGKTGQARRLNFETLNDAGHLVAWYENYNKLHGPKDLQSQSSMSPELLEKWQEVQDLAKRFGHKIEPAARPDRFLLDRKIERLEIDSLDEIITVWKLEHDF